MKIPKRQTDKQPRHPEIRWHTVQVLLFFLVGTILSTGGALLISQTAVAITTKKPKPNLSTDSYSTYRQGMRAIAGGNSVNLRWDFGVSLDTIAGYNVYRNGTKVGTTKPGSTVNFVDKEGTRYNDTKVKPNTTYRYQVEAILKTGTRKKYKTTVTVKTPTKTTPTPSISVDGGGSKGLDSWAKTVIVPEMKTWYPKISDALAYPDYKPPQKITLKFSSSGKFKEGVVASTSDSTITLSVPHFSKSKDDAGTVIHEMMHVIQNYGGNRDKAPKWLREGVADYARNIIYADHPVVAKKGQKYTDGYQTSAAFLDWVDRNYEKGYVRKINIQAHNGKLSSKSYKFKNGKSLDTAGNDMFKLKSSR